MTALLPFPLAYDAAEQRIYFADGDVEPTVAWMDADNATAELNRAQAEAIIAIVNAALEKEQQP